MGTNTGAVRRSKHASRIVAGLLAGSGLALTAGPAFAQDAVPVSEEEEEGGDIIVTGILGALQSALNEQRNADSLVEVIQAEDIGKLPDQNLAEVLENIPGVQITRTAGVGTGVQIRGTNDNRTEINGVGTVGSGTGRGGISFEDINAAIIGSVEVIKAPEAATTEGSVGGTVNLRTIRPLDIRDRILTVRAQGEYAELSDSITPRFAVSFGNNWETGIGEIGIVLAGSYAEQEATSFRPRVDRDAVVLSRAQGNNGPAAQSFPFLGIQFLNQELENFEFETINFSGSLEWAPMDNLTLFFDAIMSDQERRQDSSRVQGSGVSVLINHSVPRTFETVEFGMLDGVDLGSIQAAETGSIDVNLAVDNDDPNLRFSSDTGARLTDSRLFRLGGEWEAGDLSLRIEASRASADTVTPDLSTTLNFVNPNAPVGNANDNAVPFVYDLSGGALTFGVDFNSAFAPTVAQLLDPANVVLQAVNVSNNRSDNSEDAFRIDSSYATFETIPFLESIDVGYRYSIRSSTFNQVSSNLSLSAMRDSPRGALFQELLVPGPTNFGSADGRELFFRDFLLIDPDRSFNDPEGTLDILRAALLAQPGRRVLSDPTDNANAFFDIDEETHALYAQANFVLGPVRGNVGVRYIDTSLDSTGNTSTGGVISQVTSSGGYDEWLPRINVIAEVREDLIFRASYTEDINRPDFNSLSTSFTFPTGPNNAVVFGNPNLAPETVSSYDASLAWYFAPSAVVSLGVFHKDRSNLFVVQLEDVAVDNNGFRDITPPCEGGGIFNPIADRNVFSNVPGTGLCVPILTTINDNASTTQTGIEAVFQYDLSAFENTLGFASGFGVIANYTYQDFGGGSATNSASTRGQQIFNAINSGVGPVTAVQGLLDFSPHAYNVTLFYEKYGLSARARYTWRDAFRTLDTAGGATLNSTLGFPTVTEARGQLNASIAYQVSDFLSLGIEGVNLTKSGITQSCVNEGALLCFQGLPDRRITFGATIDF